MCTREETQKMIEVMQAYVDGKQIQLQSRSDDPCNWWSPGHSSGPQWDWDRCAYRVQPEPREWWLACLPAGVAMCPDQETAVNKCCLGRFPLVHVREVLAEGDER